MLLPSTSWTILAEATLSGGEAERKALEKFCEDYWHPVSVLIRSKGVYGERVEDLTQDFFVHMMEGSFFGRALQQKGKFRNFLLTALRNFLADDTRKIMAAKRGGDMKRVELSEETCVLEEDQLKFDLAWADTIFDAAVALTGEEVVAKRGSEGWEVLKIFLTGVGQMLSYEELGQVLGMSEGGAKSEVSRMRKKFRERLRLEVAKTVSAPHEIDEELEFLRALMMHKSVKGE